MLGSGLSTFLTLTDSQGHRAVGKAGAVRDGNANRGKNQDKDRGWERAQRSEGQFDWRPSFRKSCSNCCGKWKFGGINQCLKNYV